MFKLLGIILAVIGTSGLGFLKASEIKRRRVLLMDFKELILHISTEISYFKEPLPEIFQRLSANDNKETTILLRQNLLSYTEDNRNMAEIWKSSVDRVYQGTPLCSEDLSVMKKCGDFLGQSDYKGQQEHFSLLNVQLDRQIQEAEHAISTKGRMYGKMGVAVGLIIAVVLI